MTADDLLQAIKDRANVPPNQTALTDSKIVGFMNEEQWAYIQPLIVSLKADYFADSSDTSIVLNQASYDFPTRATAETEIVYVDSSGNEGRPIPVVDQTDVWRFNPNSGTNPLALYYLASQVVLIPTPSVASGSLRFKYSRRPSELVLDAVASSQHTAVGVVSSVNATTITLTANHNGWPASTTIDVTSASSPYKLKAKDIATTTAVAGTSTIAVSADLTASSYSVAAGDIVTLAQKSWYPQYHKEWHSLLELKTAARVCAILGDMQGKQEALRDADMMERRLVKLYTPRSSGNAKKVNAWRP